MNIDFDVDARAYFERSSDLTRSDALPVLAFLSAGFRITWFREQAARVYLAVLKPRDSVAAQFALTHEYFLVGHGYTQDFHQRTLLASPPTESEYRLDPRIRFVASGAPSMRAVCAAWAAQRRMAVVPIDTSPLRTADDQDRLPSLLALLSKSLWRRDLFDDSEPITDPSEFFGRELPVQELLSRITLGTPTALFGLRKVGKSSLLRRVQQLLADDPSNLIVSAFLQCNSTRYRAGRWFDVVSEVLRQWVGSLETCAKAVGSQVQPIAKKLAVLLRDGTVPDDARVGEAFEKDFEKVLRAGRQIAKDSGERGIRFVAVFDEIDGIYPKSAAPDYWTNDHFSLWDTLQTVKRGLERPEELVYVIGGVNPAPIEAGSLLGRPNPLFEMGSTYLQPLPSDESSRLLTGIGARLGLMFDDSAQARIHEITGGHPWLLRKLGSKVHIAFKDRGSVRVVSANEVDRVFQRTKRAFYAHIDWILDHLKQVAPDEHRLLRDIALGGKDKFFGDWANESFRDVFAEHLTQFGLVTFPGDAPELAIGLIREALAQPTAATFPEQKRQLREAVDLLEGAIRGRLARDLSSGRSVDEGIEAAVNAIPKEAKNRPRTREQLNALGKVVGLRGLLDELNWEDYLAVITHHYPDIRWSGVAVEMESRIATLRSVFRGLHLVRHNNDRELKELLDTKGFDAIYRGIQAAHEMFVS